MLKVWEIGIGPTCGGQIQSHSIVMDNLRMKLCRKNDEKTTAVDVCNIGLSK